MEENTTIGKLLTNARKKQKMSIDDVIHQTKININVLRHLEEDELESLPSRTYVRGFVINYAKAVGINQDEAKECLEYTYLVQNDPAQLENTEEHHLQGSTVSTPVQAVQKKQSNESEEIKETLTSIAQSLFNKKIFYSIVALIILGIAVNSISSFFTQLSSESRSIAKKEFNNDQPVLKSKDENLFDLKATKKLAIEKSQEEAPRAPEQEKTPIVSNLIKKLNKNLKREERAQEKPSIKKPSIEKKEALAKTETKKDQIVKANDLPKPPIKKLIINGKFPFKEFYPSPTNMYDLIADAPVVSDTSILPGNIKAAALPDKQNVYIVATEDNTWISYKVDDQKIKRYILKKGRRVLIKGNQILLFMGNFNATKVFLNNKLVSAHTKTGVKSMIFPEKNAKDFELPLFPSVNGIPYSAEEYKANMAKKAALIE